MAKQPLQKLELTWIGKGEEPKLEPRILIEDPQYSYTYYKIVDYINRNPERWQDDMFFQNHCDG